MDVQPDGTVWTNARQTEHIHKVLKAEVGQELRVGIVNGPKGVGVVHELGPARVRVACRFEEIVETLEPMIDLLLAVPRPKVLRRLWAPLASMGVRRIFLVNAEKVERQYFDTHWLDETVWRQELVLGLEQAGETRLPEVRVCRRLKPFIEDELAELFPEHQRVLCHPAEKATDWSSMRFPGAVLLAVGPEGGWNEYELGLFKAHGFEAASLGTRTLRVDTACIVLVGLVQALR